jgi:hypothetical protein
VNSCAAAATLHGASDVPLEHVRDVRDRFEGVYLGSGKDSLDREPADVGPEI